MTTTALIHGSTPSAIAHRGGERRPAAPAGTGLGGNTLAQIMEENCSDMLAAAGVVLVAATFSTRAVDDRPANPVGIG